MAGVREVRRGMGEWEVGGTAPLNLLRSARGESSSAVGCATARLRSDAARSFFDEPR